LSRAGYDVFGAHDDKTTLEAAMKYNYSLIISDIYLPEYKGFEIIRTLRQNNIKVPAIITDYSNSENESSFEIGRTIEITKEAGEIGIKSDSLLNMRIDEELTKEEYLKKKEILDRRLNELEELRKNLTYNKEDERKNIELFFERCSMLSNTFVDGLPEGKRKLVIGLAKKIMIKEKNAILNFRYSYQMVVRIKDEPDSEKWGNWCDDFRTSLYNFDYVSFHANYIAYKRISKRLHTTIVC